ncbi:MAG: MFS transporter [Erysipelotrichaceae bacterium]|nr:MFS transporter [Erysipelotrichaceae bacterium]
MKFLSKGLFEKDFMQTKVTTRNMSGKEKWLGYILGPGLVAVYTTMVEYLKEIYYVDVFDFLNVFGTRTYQSLTTMSVIASVISGLFVGYLTSRTVSKAGRFRPYVLIGYLLQAVCGIFMFWCPFDKFTQPTMFLMWIYIANILFKGVAFSLANLEISVLATSTRNIADRNQVTTLYQSLVVSIIPGVFVAVLVMGVLYYMFLEIPTETGFDIQPTLNWILFIGIPAIFAIFGAFIAYFWSRERITEDNRTINEMGEHEIQNVPVGVQLKALLTNKYFVLAVFLTMAAILRNYLQGSNVRQYFTQYVLTGPDPSIRSTLYLVVAMQPMAIGAILIPVLAKKHGVRKIAFISSIVTIIGIGICLINPRNFAVACGGGIVFSLGQVAIAFMGGVFIQQACDDVEYRHGFRPEGLLGMVIVTTVYNLILSPFSATFETGLTKAGYVAGAAEQSADVIKWIVTSYYGSYAMEALVFIVCMIFFNIEQKYPIIQAELENRRKKAAEDRGKIYHSDEELDRIEREKSEKLAEENRVADLREKCEKKGLNFEEENQKYMKKIVEKKAKAEAKKKPKK